ncbi:MAG: hypothetical protein RMK79_12925, partial [Anaerolineae bacterium]|nr:hypothetical protein [Anaerolineae bacterium]
AVSFLHVRNSHFGVPDILMTLLVSLAVWLCIIGQEKGWVLLGASFVAALAFTTKWTALPAALPLALATVMCYNSGEVKAVRISKATIVTMVAAAFGLGLVIGFPQLFLKPNIYLAFMQAQYASGEAGGFDIWQVDTVPGWVFYLKTIYTGLGSVMTVSSVLGLVGIVMSALRERHIRFSITLLLAFPVVYWVLMGSTRHYFVRYALPLVPFCAVFAAQGVDFLKEILSRWLKFDRSPWILRGVVGVIVAVAAFSPLQSSLQFDHLLNQKDTRTLAREWIEVNIPSGSKIAIDWPIHGPPLCPKDKPVAPIPCSSHVYEVTTIGGVGCRNTTLLTIEHKDMSI